MITTVEGVCRQGKIELFETPVGVQESRVLVAFLPNTMKPLSPRKAENMGRTLHEARILIAAASLMMLSASAAAQWLAPGQRIRVTAPQLSLQCQPGQLKWLDRDSLVLADGSQRWVVPRELLMQLDLSRGRHGHLVAGLAVGAAVGFGVGAILFSPNSTGCTGSGDYAENCQLYRAGIVVGGVGLGALVGALIRTEQWAALPLGSVQFSPTPRSLPP